VQDADTIGCAPFTVTFYNKSAGLTASNFIWDFGDGTTSTEKNPTHTFNTTNSVYSVNLSITNNVCPDNNTKPISTHPLANVVITADTTLCYGEQTTISASGDFSAITWSPASQITNVNSATTQYIPKKSGYIFANLQTNYGCTSSDSVFVYVQQYPRYQGAPDSLLLFYKTPTVLELAKQPDSRIIAGQLYNVNNTPVQGVAYSWNPSTYLSCDNCISPNIDLHVGNHHTQVV
jgi:PKD repeat protein